MKKRVNNYEEAQNELEQLYRDIWSAILAQNPLMSDEEQRLLSLNAASNLLLDMCSDFNMRPMEGLSHLLRMIAAKQH
jgi:hypothetical protein